MKINVVEVLHRFSDDNEGDFRPALVGVMDIEATVKYDELSDDDEALVKWLDKTLPDGYTDEDICYYIRWNSSDEFYGALLIEEDYDNGDQIFRSENDDGRLALALLGKAYGEWVAMQQKQGKSLDPTEFAKHIYQAVNIIGKTICD